MECAIFAMVPLKIGLVKGAITRLQVKDFFPLVDIDSLSEASLINSYSAELIKRADLLCSSEVSFKKFLYLKRLLSFV